MNLFSQLNPVRLPRAVTAILIALLGSLSLAHAASSVTLAWDPNPESDIAGYRVHYGTMSGNYTQMLDVGNNTTATVSNLSSASTYFFVVTAYNTSGLESLPSSEIAFFPNQGPVALNDSVATDEGTSVTINVLSNDTDPDNSPGTLKLLSVGSAANGTTSITGNAVAYSPKRGFFGTETFSYTITDGVATASASVTVTVRYTAKAFNLNDFSLTGTNIGTGSGFARVLSDDSWDVLGIGTGATGLADNVHFESGKEIGNFQAIVRVHSIYNSGPAPEVGLMLRESSAVNARFAMFAATPGGYSVGWRATTGGIASKTALNFPVRFPDVWLLIERTGDTIQFATSSDGVNFDFIGSTVIASLADELDLGLFVSSGTANAYASAVFTDYSVMEIASAPEAKGLSADYFDDMTLTNRKLSRRDATVDFNWGASSPDPAIPSDKFSVRWKGKVEPRYTETYSFHTISDDGVRLWVNGTLLINNWTVHAPVMDTGSITLTAGQKYDIVMEYYESGGNATASLLWSSATQAMEIIPESALTPANTGVRIGAGTGSSHVFADGTWQIKGAGTAFVGSSDNLYFESSQFDGDFQVVTRVTSFTGANASGRAGLMIRESNSANARFAAIGATSSNIYVGALRGVVGAIPAQFVPVAPYNAFQSPNAWMLIERVGDLITFAVSTDDVTWNVVNVIELKGLSSNVRVGAFVTSGLPDSEATAGFTDYEIQAIE